VNWCLDKRKWRARIHLDGQERLPGYFDELADAARAYDETAMSCFGEFATPNSVLSTRNL
jgi:hypothetical protein